MKKVRKENINLKAVMARVDLDTYKALHTIADSERRSVSSLLNIIIGLHLAGLKGKKA